ncbi:hypothetical protein [Sphingomonas phyllosphaerae]|uniref:hypothetical protein n=1 Tax=Sphingomonas phyllosphaerae TaxID=257003 RepID=UPI0003B35091|nr:hypothetical protein [Sphingomonas phyllosphaerae]
MTGLNTISDAPATATAARIRQLTHHSSMHENILMHLLLAQLGLELTARGIEYDELHSRVDKEGFDVLLEAGGVARHIQLKAKTLGRKGRVISVNTGLAAKPSGCVVWLTFDPDERRFCDIRWFGAAPGKPLPDVGTKVAKHSRANSHGVKAERQKHRVLSLSRFKRLDDIAHLADHMFGLQSTDPVAFLCSRLHADAPAQAWLQSVTAGRFGAIPADVSWENGGAELAALINGYPLLELISDEQPAAFLERQRAEWNSTGRWSGDGITLWTTLFLELRADRFGASDVATSYERLDALAQQLRQALIELETADA